MRPVAEVKRSRSLRLGGRICTIANGSGESPLLMFAKYSDRHRSETRDAGKGATCHARTNERAFVDPLCECSTALPKGELVTIFRETR